MQQQEINNLNNFEKEKKMIKAHTIDQDHHNDNGLDKQEKIKSDVNIYYYTQSHFFNVGYASDFGVQEAILINNFIYIISYHRENGTHFHEGRTWCYDSVAGLVSRFPYWTPKQIRTIIDKLVQQEVLVKGNFNKVGYDQTTWYSFKDEARFLGPKSVEIEAESHLPKKANRFAQKGEPIPLETFNNKKNIKKEKKEKKVYHSLSEDFTVPEEWIIWVMNEYGSNEEFTRDNAVKFANYYTDNGKKYKDWRKTWQNWMLSNKNNPIYSTHFKKKDKTSSTIKIKTIENLDIPNNLNDIEKKVYQYAQGNFLYHTTLQKMIRENLKLKQNDHGQLVMTFNNDKSMFFWDKMYDELSVFVSKMNFRISDENRPGSSKAAA